MALAVAAAAVSAFAVWFYLGILKTIGLSLLFVLLFLLVFHTRWCYVALRTAPRDLKALFCYVKLLWLTKKLQWKNWAIPDVFHETVQKHPDKACFLFENRTWTFKEVEDFSLKVTAVLKKQGVTKGSIVGLLVNNVPELPCFWMGISRLGGITPLINTNQRGKALLHSIQVAKCSVVIFSEENLSAIQELTGQLDPSIKLFKYTHASATPLSDSGDSKVESLNDLLKSTPPAPWSLSNGDGFHGKLLYIYTSGTTGLPKAAVISSSRIVFMAAGLHYLGGLRSSDVIYCSLPLYHTAGGVISVGQALLFGCTVVVKNKFSASQYFPDCIKYNATEAREVLLGQDNSLMGITDQHEMLVDSRWLPHAVGHYGKLGEAYVQQWTSHSGKVAHYIGEMCRYVLATPPSPADTQHKVRVVFGNGLRPQIWNEFIKRFNIKHVAEFYGATEGNANIVNIDGKPGAIGFVSRIFPSVYPIAIIKVDQETGEPIRDSQGLCQLAQPEEPGVFIGKISPNNPSRAFLGYVDKAASDKKVVHDVFTRGDTAFISGDILVADEFGYLYFRDRTGDTFRWRGENVSTTEVEATVSRIVNQRDAVVYGVLVSNYEGRAGMCAIVDMDGTLDLDKLARELGKDLPSYARPTFLRVMAQGMDMTGTFKMKKTDLQKEGFDPHLIKDKMFYLDSKLGKYQPLGAVEFDKINSGQIRL